MGVAFAKALHILHHGLEPVLSGKTGVPPCMGLPNKAAVGNVQVVFAQEVAKMFLA